MARIKKFNFKNIRSYGNNVTEIPFDLDNGLVLISGKNGGGKTSIVEALEYAIYGSSSRVAIKDLPNWFNDNAFTSVTFETDDNREVELSRGISPDFYDLKINGNKKLNSKDKSENKANKTKIDQMVADELFKISQDIFANNILLSIHDFKSFIKMKPADKRKIIDKIFDTHIFNDMNVVLKKELSEYKEKYNAISEVISSKKYTLDSTNERIDDIKSTIDDDQDIIISELKLSMESINSRINTLVNDKTSIESKLNKLNLDYNEYLNKIREVESQLNLDYSNKLKNIQDILNTTLNEKRSNIQILKQNDIDSIKSKYKDMLDKIVLPENNIGNVVKNIDNEILVNKDNLDKSIANIIIDKDKELEKIKKEYDSHLVKINDEFNNILIKKQNDIDVLKVDISNISSIIDQSKSIRDSIFSEISNVQSKLDLYTNDKCYTCGTDLKSESFHINKKESFDTEISQLNEKLQTITQELGNNISLKSDKEIIYTSLVDEINKFSKEHESILNQSNVQFINMKNSIESKYADSLYKLNEHHIEIKTKLDSKKDSIIENEQNRYNTERNNVDSLCNNEIKEVDAKYYDEYAKFEGGLRKKYDSDIEIINKEFESGKESINNKTVEKIEAFKNGINSETIKIKNVNDLIISENLNRDNVMIKLNTIQNGDSVRVLTELSNISKSLDDDIAKLQLDASEYEQKIWIRESAQYLIGENGLKKMIMKNILPSFNSTISKITTLFDFKYRFMFDENFDAHLTYCGKNIPITVSRGEGKIMDIIVILSTLQLILMKHSNINILFLDEIFSNLDIENIAKAVSILKDYAKKYNLTIFVMSHTPVPYEFFDKIITVDFDGTFSNIKSIE